MFIKLIDNSAAIKIIDERLAYLNAHVESTEREAGHAMVRFKDAQTEFTREIERLSSDKIRTLREIRDMEESRKILVGTQP